jgi:GrpB-like predicted nucleotidyltransferase (UPF0157 family)
MTDEESLEQAIHEQVTLKVYDPNWPVLFAAERSRLMQLLPQILAIEHIGSTAVEGMTAKPVIDVMAGVATLQIAEALAPALCRNGYTTSIEFNASLDDRKWFMRWADGHRTHHLHVMVHNARPWLDRLQFRDALRSSAELASRYVDLKQQLAGSHARDREAYTAAKTAFVQDVLSRA